MKGGVKNPDSEVTDFKISEGFSLLLVTLVILEF